MAEIRKPAVKFSQGKRDLFLTFFTVRDFMARDFYRVDRLDVRESKGMQRLLNEARARSLGRDILDADEHNEAFLPTSIFLATSGKVSYDESTRELFFDSAPHAGVCPLDVVDGQHRIKGLEHAAKENDRLLDFPVSVVLAPGMSEQDKRLHFIVVNVKQEPVKKDVEQYITSEFTKEWKIAELPHLPRWLRKNVEIGDDDKALTIAKELNSDEESPWYGRIQFADERKNPKHAIRQVSFVTNVKKIVLANHLIGTYIGDDIKRQIGFLRNYWRAVREIFVAEDSDNVDAVANTVVFKFTGLLFFHSILVQVMHILAKNDDYTLAAIKKCLLKARGNLPPEAANVLEPEFWESGGEPSGWNRGATAKMASVFSKALREANSGGIQI